MKAYQNLQVTGSVSVSGSVHAVYVYSTASFSNTASYIHPGATASYALTSSYLSGSSATVQNLTVAGTASIKYLNVAFESSSVIFSSGSNQFGDAFDDKHTFTGSVGITGSLTMDSGSSANLGNITGSLSGSFTGSAKGIFTGSFSGSYSGSGHQLFDISASAIIGLNLASIATGSVTASVSSDNGFVIKSIMSGSTFSGSLKVISGSIYMQDSASGVNMFGTASHAVTASYLSGSAPGFPYTGSAVISGTLYVSNSVTGSNIFGTASWAEYVLNGAPSTIVSASTPPVTSVSGTLWFDTIKGNLYVQATSPTGSNWLPTSLTMVTGSVTASVHHTDGFIVNSLASGSQFTGSVTVHSGSVTVSTGSITITTGSLVVNSGSLTINTGSLTITSGTLNVTNLATITGSLYMTYATASQTTGTNIFGTASWAANIAPQTIISASAPPTTSVSGTMWWNTNDGNLYVQVNSPSGSGWVPATTTVANGQYGATVTTAQATAATTWSIVHNLNTSTPIVQVYTGSQVMVPASIRAVNVNSLEITFATATAGTSVVSTGVGGPTSASFALTAADLLLARTASYLNDTAAAAAGVPLYGVYRSASFVLVRTV